MIVLVLTDPMEDLDLPPTLELGPFDSVWYERGKWFGDGEVVAEVFEETMDDIASHVVGHPAAGKVFAPRTFYAFEIDDADYPGKPYRRVAIRCGVTA